MCGECTSDATITACAVAMLGRSFVLVYQDGTTACAWMRWNGYPYPLRVCLWLVFRREWPWRKVRKLPGCGCVVVLKDRWNGVREWADRSRSRFASFSS